MLYFDEQDCMILDHRSQSDGCCRNVVEEDDWLCLSRAVSTCVAVSVAHILQ